jgi:hypothetical protein
MQRLFHLSMLVLFGLLIGLPCEANAQLLWRRAYQPQPICTGPNCPAPVVLYSTPQPSIPTIPVVLQAGQEIAQAEWYSVLVASPGRAITKLQDETVRAWANRAVRVLNGNSCGTGSLVGRDDKYIYVMTNAHVASSRIGHAVQCQARTTLGRIEQFQATVIESAYSSRTSTDWSLLRADRQYMAGLTPIQMSTEAPRPEALTGTWGCPRCEVPRGQVLETRQLGSIWYWQPNSIGGQSGSAVVQGDKLDPVQVGLLTWTINGDGAGQLTSTIYRQSRERNTDGPARVPGMLVPTYAGTPDVELIEGYHAEAGLGEYPIWKAIGPPNDPVDPVDPADPCPDIDDNTRQLLGLRDRLQDRGYDWASIISLIIQLIELIAKGRG